MADVFISYKKDADSKFAQTVQDKLIILSVSVFIDQNIGKTGDPDWYDILENEINAAGAVLVLWTSDSLNSRWVRKEAGYRPDKLVGAAFGEDVQRRLPLAFSDLHAPNLGPWFNDGATHGDKQWQNVLGLLGRHLRRPGLPELASCLHEDTDEARRRFIRRFPDDPGSMQLGEELALSERRRCKEKLASIKDHLKSRVRDINEVIKGCDETIQSRIELARLGQQSPQDPFQTIDSMVANFDVLAHAVEELGAGKSPEVAELQGELAVATGRMKTLGAEVERLASVERESAALTEQLADLRSADADAQRAISAAAEHAQATAAELMEARQTAGLQAEAAKAATARADNAERALAMAGGEVATLQAKVAELGRSGESTAVTVDALRKELADRDESAASLQQELREREAALATTVETLDQAREALRQAGTGRTAGPTDGAESGPRDVPGATIWFRFVHHRPARSMGLAAFLGACLTLAVGFAFGFPRTAGFDSGSDARVELARMNAALDQARAEAAKARVELDTARSGFQARESEFRAELARVGDLLRQAQGELTRTMAELDKVRLEIGRRPAADPGDDRAEVRRCDEQAGYRFDPDRPDAHPWQSSHEAIGNLEGALADCEASARTSPSKITERRMILNQGRVYAGFGSRSAKANDLEGARRQFSEALRLWTRAAELGSSQAHYTIGVYYRGGAFTVQAAGRRPFEPARQDLDRMVTAFQRSAELGNPFAQVAMSYYLMFPDWNDKKYAVVPRNDRLARRYLMASSEYDIPYRSYVIGMARLYGRAEYETDEDAALANIAFAACRGERAAKDFFAATRNDKWRKAEPSSDQCDRMRAD